MGRQYRFRLGSFYRQDDKSGFAVRAEHTRRQWDSQIVDERIFEPRQPQDFVRGRRDNQAVPDARPLAPDQFVGPFWTAVTAAVVIGATTIPVQSTGGFTLGNTVAIMLSDGTLFRAVLSAIGAGTLTINNPLPRIVFVGAQIWDYGQ